MIHVSLISVLEARSQTRCQDYQNHLYLLQQPTANYTQYSVRRLRSKGDSDQSPAVVDSRDLKAILPYRDVGFLAR